MGAGVRCNNTVTVTFNTSKYSAFLEVLEGLNAVLGKAYSTPRPQLCFKLNLKPKNGSCKKCLGETLLLILLSIKINCQ